MNKAQEVNFDGIVGPTHNYGGLSFGNIASMKHKAIISSPKQAALEGLKKMKLLADLGVPQAVLPPQERPSLSHLRALGFEGNDGAILEKARQTSPILLEAVSSASAMWAANAATATPSCDNADGKVHLTVANLLNRYHRSIEAKTTTLLFRHLFKDERHFIVHSPLEKGGHFGDEGDANHIRFCTDYGKKGVNLFVYGKSAFEDQSGAFPARHAKEASESIARLHALDPRFTVFARQNPELIDLGVFHNDVISVGNRTHFLFHERAFIDTPRILAQLQTQIPLNLLPIAEEMLPAKKAVETYFFNSQLVTLPDNTDFLLAPEECRCLDLSWLPFKIGFINLKQSMQNGGGPACLRFRIVLTQMEKKSLPQEFFLTETLYRTLVSWVERHYRDQLHPNDLSDPLLLDESRRALDELTQILQLGSFYEFQ